MTLILVPSCVYPGFGVPRTAWDSPPHDPVQDKQLEDRWMDINSSSLCLTTGMKGSLQCFLPSRLCICFSVTSTYAVCKGSAFFKIYLTYQIFCILCQVKNVTQTVSHFCKGFHFCIPKTIYVSFQQSVFPTPLNNCTHFPVQKTLLLWFKLRLITWVCHCVVCHFV